MKTAILALLLVCATPLSFGQKHSTWPTSLPHDGHLVSVLTISQPDVRQACLVRSVDANSLSCEQPGTGARVIYPRDQVVAILGLAPRGFSFKDGVLCALIGGTVALLIVNPLVAIVIGPVWLYAEFIHDATAPLHPPQPKPARHERVLYQQPGSTLAIQLS